MPKKSVLSTLDLNTIRVKQHSWASVRLQKTLGQNRNKYRP